MAEAGTYRTELAILRLVDEFSRRKDIIMVFTKADAMALEEHQADLFDRLLASEGAAEKFHCGNGYAAVIAVLHWYSMR